MDANVQAIVAGAHETELASLVASGQCSKETAIALSALIIGTNGTMNVGMINMSLTDKDTGKPTSIAMSIINALKLNKPIYGEKTGGQLTMSLPSTAHDEDESGKNEELANLKNDMIKLGGGYEPGKEPAKAS